MLKNKKGFTVVELALVIVGLSVVGSVGYVVMHFIRKFW